jgi:hypothetical protein
MKRTYLWMACAGLTLGWTACSDDDSSATGTETDASSSGSTADSMEGPACTDGQTQACTCTDGSSGEAQCVGGTFGACECAGADETSSSSGPPATDTSDDGSSSSGGVPTTCGDGTVDEGEQCDDGDDDDTNECSNACVPHCGSIWYAELDTVGGQNINRLADGTLFVGARAGRKGALSLSGYILDDTGATVSNATSAVVLAEEEVSLTAADGDGNVYIVGSIALDGEADPSPRLLKLVADSYALDWDVALDPAVDFEFGRAGIAITPEGDVVISGRIEVADGDTDVWVSTRAASDGAETANSTYTGELVKGFSIDFGGPLAVDADGTIGAAGLLRRSFNQLDVSPASIPAAGGAPTWVDSPLLDPGPSNDQEADGLAYADGRLVVPITSFVGGSTSSNRFDVFVYDGETVAWDASSSDLKIDAGGEFVMFPSLGPDGSVMLGGHFFDTEQELIESLVVRYDAAGAVTCALTFEGATDTNRFINGVVGLDDGSMVAVGTLDTEPETTWVSRFRP